MHRQFFEMLKATIFYSILQRAKLITIKHWLKQPHIYLAQKQHYQFVIN